MSIYTYLGLILGILTIAILALLVMKTCDKARRKHLLILAIIASCAVYLMNLIGAVSAIQYTSSESVGGHLSHQEQRIGLAPLIGRVDFRPLKLYY